MHPPDETVRLTLLPSVAKAPDAGIWLITVPSATVALHCCVTVPTTNPPAVMFVVAAAWV